MWICEAAPNLNKSLSGLMPVKIHYISEHLEETTLDNKIVQYLFFWKTLV